MSLAPVCPTATPSGGALGSTLAPLVSVAEGSKAWAVSQSHPEEEIALSCASVSPLAKEEKRSQNFEKSMLGAHIIQEVCGSFS